jgi:hypothetical protein
MRWNRSGNSWRCKGQRNTRMGLASSHRHRGHHTRSRLRIRASKNVIQSKTPMSYAFLSALSAAEVGQPSWYVAYEWDWGKRAWASTGWVQSQFAMPILSREADSCHGEYTCEYTWGNTERRWVKQFCDPASAGACPGGA